MQSLFDDIPTAPQTRATPVYGEGSTYAGQPATPGQVAYARAGEQYRDPSAPAGTAQNPSYDTPDRAGTDAQFHVTPDGLLSAPGPEGGLFDDLPIGRVGHLPGTPAMRAALADLDKPDVSQQGETPAQIASDRMHAATWVNAASLGYGPEVMGSMRYLDTAGSNLAKRLSGEPVPYGASDTFSATRASTRDAIEALRAQNPRDATGINVLGAILHPINTVGGGFIADAYKGRAGLKALGVATGRSGIVGGAEGAVYGSGSTPDDRLSGAWRGGATGATVGMLAAPVAAGGAGLVRGAVNGVKRYAAGPVATVGIAMPDLTPAQMDAAQALRIDMQGRGVNISLPEAVQQVTNNGTGLGRTLRVLEGTKQGEGLLAPYFAPRTQQVQSAVTGFADRVAPPTTLPSAIGPRAQEAAQGGLDSLRQNINAEAKPHYDAMGIGAGNARFVFNKTTGAPRYIAGPGQVIPEKAFEPLAKNTAYAESLAQVRSDPLLNADIAHLPDNNVGVVNEVVKQLDRNAIGQAQTAVNPGGNNFKASLYQGARDLADQVASEHSPQWRAARDVVSQGRGWLLDPLQAGPVGRIAASDSVPAQVGALYPRNPLAGAPNETSTAMGVLNHQQPGVGADLTRQYMLGEINGARPMLQGGENPYLGSAFAARVAGSPEQQANLLSGVQASAPNGTALSADLDRLLEGLRATGKRQPAGSRTAFNASDLSDMHVSGATKVLRRIADPLEWGAGVADLIDRANWQRNVEGLANMFTVPPEQTAETLAAAKAAAPPNPNFTLPALPYPAATQLLPSTRPSSR